MAYYSMVQLPKSARRRLARHSLMGLAGATIVLPLAVGVVADPIWRDLGWALWLCSLGMAVVALLIGGRISRAISFYLTETAIVLNSMVVFLFLGLASLQAGLGTSFAGIVAPGLATGLLSTPLIIRDRAKFMREAIDRGHLRRSMDQRAATWDPRFDADNMLRHPRIRRPGCLLSLLFWSGPAIGLHLADIVGRLSALVITGLLMTGLAYYAVVAGITKLVVIVVELGRFERNLGRPILLPPDFIKGGRDRSQEGGGEV